LLKFISIKNKVTVPPPSFVSRSQKQNNAKYIII